MGVRMSCGKKCNSPSLPYTHTLLVERPGTTAEADGTIDLIDDANWSAVGRIRARFVTKRGDETARTEKTAHRQVVGTVDCVVMANATAIAISLTANPTWRLRLGNRKFNVTSAWLVNETGREVLINVTEHK